MTLPKTAVPIPELGDAAYFRMTVNAMLEIQEKMMDPADWETDGAGWQRFYTWLDHLDLARMKRIATICIEDSSVDLLFERVAPDLIAERLSDALTIAIYGRTTAEQVARREQEYAEHLRKLVEKKKAAEE